MFALSLAPLIRKQGSHVAWAFPFAAIYSTPRAEVAIYLAKMEHLGVVFIPSYALTRRGPSKEGIKPPEQMVTCAFSLCLLCMKHHSPTYEIGVEYWHVTKWSASS